MNILLVGYGTMNKRVAVLAEARGHSIVGIITSSNEKSIPYPVFTSFNDMLPEADVVIDFSHPVLTKQLLQSSLSIPLVVATTGDKERITSLLEEKAETQPVFFSANMSYGGHVLTEIIKYATPLLEDFDIEMIEKHHNKKVDAPSGTLVKLYDAIVESSKNTTVPIYDRHKKTNKREKNEIGISSIRGGTIIGEHEVIYAGLDEEITIKHRAQSKDIYVNGALTIAEKLIIKKDGYYTYQNMM